MRDGVTIRLRQADLAQLAGTSRESVSRFLATLERAGVVRVGRGRVTVIEPERLAPTSSDGPPARAARLRRSTRADGRAPAPPPRHRRRAGARGDGARPARAVRARRGARGAPTTTRRCRSATSRRSPSPGWSPRSARRSSSTGDERVLEIGTGSGYSAAVLAQLAASVISLERDRRSSARARAGRLAELGRRERRGDRRRRQPRPPGGRALRRDRGPRRHARGAAQPARPARRRAAAWWCRSRPARPTCSPSSAATETVAAPGDDRPVPLRAADRRRGLRAPPERGFDRCTGSRHAASQ